MLRGSCYISLFLHIRRLRRLLYSSIADAATLVYGVSNGMAKVRTAPAAGVAPSTAMFVFTVCKFNAVIVSDTELCGAEIPLAEGAAGVQYRLCSRDDSDSGKSLTTNNIDLFSTDLLFKIFPATLLSQSLSSSRDAAAIAEDIGPCQIPHFRVADSGD